MKKKIAVGAVLIALLLAGGMLWYTRRGLLCGISRVSGGAGHSCSATLLPTYTNDAIQNVEIAPGSPDCRQLLELLNGETYTRQIGFVSNAQRITLSPITPSSPSAGGRSADPHLLRPSGGGGGEHPGGSRSMALHPQGGEEFQAPCGVDRLPRPRRGG